MKLEQQVASLELSKRLKELGVKQESAFQWNKNHRNDHWHLLAFNGENRFNQERIAAFTCAELIELLGPKFGVLERFKHSGKFGAYIPNDIGTSATGEKVADVLAQLLMETYEGSEESPK